MTNARATDLWPFAALCLVSFLSGFANAPFNALLPVYVDAALERVPLFAGSLRSVNLVIGGLLAMLHESSHSKTHTRPKRPTLLPPRREPHAFDTRAGSARGAHARRLRPRIALRRRLS